MEDSYNNYNSCLELVENEFIVFKSIYDILYLIYTKVDKKENIESIIIYNLLDNVKVSEIRNKGIENIKYIKYCKDNTNKRDLILVFYFYAGIKLWDVNNLDNILTINGRNNTFSFNYSCFINLNNQIYIISNIPIYNTSYFAFRVHNLKGNIEKDININNSNYLKKIIFMICYYDDKLCKNYIISYIKDGEENNNFILSIDFNENKECNKYYSKDDIYTVNIIMHNGKELKMIESSGKENIRIWDFHSGNLIQTIKTKCLFYGLSLWDDENLLVSCKSKEIKIIKIKGGKIISLYNHSKVYFAQKIVHSQYGECLISQNSDNTIKLFIDRNIIK